MTADQKHHVHQHAVTISIDGDVVVAPTRKQTARELLALVGLSADANYLVLVKGQRDRESYKDRPDEPIHLRPHMQFIHVSLGPVPVS